MGLRATLLYKAALACKAVYTAEKSGVDSSKRWCTRTTFAVYADEVLQRVGPKWAKNQVWKGAFKPNLYAIKSLDTD